MFTERCVLAHVWSEERRLIVAAAVTSAAAMGAQARVKALSAEGHRRRQVVHSLVISLVMTISSESSNSVTSTNAGTSGLAHASVVLMLVMVVAIVGAKSGRVGRQGLRGSGADRRAGKMSVRRLTLMSVECSVVGRGLRGRVNGAAVVDRVGRVRAADAGRHASEVTSHPGAFDS